MGKQLWILWEHPWILPWKIEFFIGIGRGYHVFFFEFTLLGGCSWGAHLHQLG